MRDPVRIDRIMRRINMIWQTNPDLRLLQIIETSLTMAGLAHTKTTDYKEVCFYYMEDDAFEHGLELFYDKIITSSVR